MGPPTCPKRTHHRMMGMRATESAGQSWREWQAGDNKRKVGKAEENQQKSALETGPERELEGRQPVKNTEGSHLQVP